ncbi:MAG TPA: hypothetical protein VMB50_06525 [Myxococcales bacterium]|nr:hypothetical protein [Myxococcales bacterium]
MPSSLAKLIAVIAVSVSLGCSGGSGGTGGSSTGDGQGTTGTSGGTTGGSTGSGGSTGGDPTTCTIPDAGTVARGAPNPSNPCETCDPSSSATSWSPQVICFACQLGSASGLCISGGRCCTSRCNGAQCELPDGGVSNSNCQADSDCCGVVAGCP